MGGFGNSKVRFTKQRVNREVRKRKSQDLTWDEDAGWSKEDSGYKSADSKRSKYSASGSLNTPRLSQIQSQSETPISSLPNSQSVRRRLKFNDRASQSYFESINIKADTMCEICCRLMYSDQTRKRNRTARICELIYNKGFEVNRNFDCCRNCSLILNQNKMPVYSLYNDLDPGALPEELDSLTDVETRLISRIKPFMKIYRYGKYILK